MLIRIVILSLCGFGLVPLWGQGGKTSGCLPSGEYEPVLVNNPGARVTFQCEKATAFEAIRAIGIQTRVPIGVVLGRDLDALSTSSHSFDLVDVDARSALLIAIEGTGYSIKQEGEVMELVAGDLAPRQRELLVYPLSNFMNGQASGKMACLGQELTGWLMSAVHPKLGYGGSCPTSMNEEEIRLDIAPVATTEEIANQIVSQGSKGMWVFKVSADPSVGNPTKGEPTEYIDVLAYQHNSNRPIVRR